MTKKEIIDEFLSHSAIAVVGVSSNKKKFGNICYHDLKTKGLEVHAVNPRLNEIEGDKCYASLLEVPGQVKAALLVVPPAETEKVVEDAFRAGITHIWMQQGAESEKAIKYCEKNNIKVISKECILMFAPPVKDFHRFHRWVWKVIGKLPR